MSIDPIIQQKADDIRMKVYGEQVRESLASGLEEMSKVVVENKSRQDTVESQFQEVIDETTGKDVISAPEIIAARNNEANLKARLDKENQEVTAQLAHTPTKTEVFLKSQGININDWDEPTRQAFLEAQGIDVNYILGKGNVNPANTNFLTKGKNLYNFSTSNDGYFVSPTNGSLVSTVNHSVSDYIGIESGKRYVKNVEGHVAFYTLDKTFISGIADFNAREGDSFVAPSDAACLRFTVKNYETHKAITQLEKGGIPTEYENYHHYKADSLVNYKNQPTKAEDIEFLIKSKNLFNKEKAIDNQLINYSSGRLQAANGQSSSDYIAVLPNTQYVKNVQGHVAFYDENGIYISGIQDVIAVSGYFFTTPNNAAYLRFTVKNADTDKETAQLEKGRSITTFVKYDFYNFDTERINVSPAQDGEGADVLGKSRNLFNKTTALDDYYVNHGFGTVHSNSTYSTSDYIEVLPNTEYIKNTIGHVVFYDAERTYISGIPENDLSINPFTTPDNCGYLRFSIRDYAVDKNKEKTQLEVGDISTPYVPYDGNELKDTIRVDNVLMSETGRSTIEYVTSQVSRYRGKKLGTLGDSLTYASKYQRVLKKELGFGKIVNYGIGGTCISTNSADPFVTRYPDMVNDLDVLLVMGGTNDFGQSVEMDNEQDEYDVSTFKGALRVLLEGLTEKYPTKIILFCTLPPRFDVDKFNGYVNDAGLTAKDYADATIEICREYSIPCLDTFGNIGSNEKNESSLFTDQIHFNDFGYERLGGLMSSKLLQLW